LTNTWPFNAFQDANGYVNKNEKEKRGKNSKELKGGFLLEAISYSGIFCVA
jgi:hypothetical protein